MNPNNIKQQPYQNQSIASGKTKSVLGTFSSTNKEMQGPGYQEPMSKTNFKNSPTQSNMASSEMKSHFSGPHYKTHHQQSTSLGAQAKYENVNSVKSNEMN